jgi:hypothetical protein
MDGSQASPPGVRVTIEATLPDRAASRELAQGMLLGGQAVMVPGPPLELLRAGGPLIAIITGNAPYGSSSAIIPVAHITRLRLKSAGLNAACAVLRLIRPVLPAPAAPRHPAPLMAALRAHEGIGWDEDYAEDGLWDYEVSSPKDFITGICYVCRCCGASAGKAAFDELRENEIAGQRN